LASSSRTWASCALMPAPLVGKAGARLAPGCGVRLCRLPLFCLRCRHVHQRRPRSTHVRGRSFRCWNRRSSQTSSPWRQGTAGTSPGSACRRSPTRHTRVRSRVAAHWLSRGMTRRWW
jgi:hypothetical protein